ncbi:hypothetical protein ACJRO7_015944 [Eucalyptus globulus]|uniref:Transmembrane protein n=1 Tax=Eucalyptus globulus TaxID=34317 RepID=A0ABD3L6J1_EUCGL
MSAVKLRSSYSLPNHLLSCLQFILFTLSAASLAPTILLKIPPTLLGLAFPVMSSVLFISFVGFYSQLLRFCFMTHFLILLALLSSQVLSIRVLFTRETSRLSLLRSQRLEEAKVLLVVLVRTCIVHNCWVRECEGLGAKRYVVEEKRSMRIAKVREESMANAARIVEVKANRKFLVLAH